MLSLGAACEGCLEGLGPHLPALFGFLIQQQKAETPQLRGIACWVLGRFMRCVFFFSSGLGHVCVRACVCLLIMSSTDLTCRSSARVRHYFVGGNTNRAFVACLLCSRVVAVVTERSR